MRLRYALEGFDDLERKLLTLRRLAALWRLGRMPARLFPRDLRAPRWIEMLRTLDAMRSGASQREIAEALFEPGRVARDWRAGSDYLRMRIQRLVRASDRMARRDYRRLIGGTIAVP
ncbi:DNA -binding domain-containing protein [Sphingomonas agrestis]|uniref:DNA -binding domain-containing protein n=1 Tax=Sphingomonas agrestis TaxID=3080540 RepID=UPI00374DCBE4